jgi:rhodanese-related sulfurtransferase
MYLVIPECERLPEKPVKDRIAAWRTFISMTRCLRRRGMKCALPLLPFLAFFCLWACPGPPPAAPSMAELSPLELQHRLMKGDPPVPIDTGSYLECMDERIPGALCMACDEVDRSATRLEPFRGRLLVFYNRGPSVGKPCRALEEIKAKGFQNIVMLAGGISAWKMAGYGTESLQRIHRFGIPSLQAKVLDDWIQSHKELLILDIRSSERYRENGLKGAMNIPLSQLHDRYPEIPMNLPILVADTDGSSSMLAASFLHWKGFKDLRRLRGGLEAWDAYRKRRIP